MNNNALQYNSDPLYREAIVAKIWIGIRGTRTTFGVAPANFGKSSDIQ